MLNQLQVIFVFIRLVTCISNQEDLAISTYSQIGCLTLKADKQLISNGIQEDPRPAYQTFSSPNLTIDLCFRLCRRWIILMNVNQTSCFCLYTMNELYEINEYLGEVLPITNCSTDALQVYSLTEDPYLLPSPTPNDDWSLEGCYYLHGIQTYHANILLNDMNYTQAMDACRKQCQAIRTPTYFAFFLSLKKYCYCLPIKLSSTTTTTAVRKPLLHCSFLPYIKRAFNQSFNHSEVNLDTVVKINVQRYCSASFIFDRTLYRCMKVVPLNAFTSYAKIAANETCSPVLIKTSEQWSHLFSLPPLLRSRTFIWIDRNSTSILNDLFQSKMNSSTSDNLCLMINRTRSPPYDLLPCSVIQSPGYIFCTQKTHGNHRFQSFRISLDVRIRISTMFHLRFFRNPLPIMTNVTCPIGFVLFNNLCYYVDKSFVYSLRHGEQLCSTKSGNSSLVQLQSHQWGNVNTTRFLGRTMDDILLELFYYQLEKKLPAETKNKTKTKHWLRLLVGDQNSDKECVLRYFLRSSGTFTIFQRCDEGGHPVCQSQPIVINETRDRSLDVENKTESITTTTTEIPGPIVFNGTADDDLGDSETSTDGIANQKTKVRLNYRLLLKIVSIPLLFLGILLVSIVFLIRYIRRTRGSYSTGHSRAVRPFPRRKRPSINTTTTDTANTPVALYTRLQAPPPDIILDETAANTFDNSIINDERVQLLPSPINPITLHESHIVEQNNDDEESLYAIPNLPHEK